MLHPEKVIRSVFVLVLLACVIYGSHAHAAARALFVVPKSSVNINAIPYKVQWIPTASGVAANSAQYVTRSVGYSAATIAELARPFLLTPGGALLTAAMIAAGYVIDQLTGEVSQPGEEVLAEYRWRFGLTDYHCGGCTVQYYGFTPELVAAAIIDPYVYANDLREMSLNYCGAPAATTSCNFNKTNWNWSTGTLNLTFTREVAPPDSYYTEEETIMTDQELADYIANSPYGEQFIRDMLTDVNGEPVETIELSDMLADVDADFNAQYDSDPATNPTVDINTGDTGTESQEETLTDCDFQPTLCKWLEWYKTEGTQPDAPPETGLYEPDPELTYTKVLGDFNTAVLATPLGTGLTDFFAVSVTGSCPVWTLPATYFTPAIPIDVQCSSVMDTVFLMVSAVMIATSAFIGFRWAFL